MTAIYADPNNIVVLSRLLNIDIQQAGKMYLETMFYIPNSDHAEIMLWAEQLSNLPVSYPLELNANEALFIPQPVLP